LIRCAVRSGGHAVVICNKVTGNFPWVKSAASSPPKDRGSGCSTPFELFQTGHSRKHLSTDQRRDGFFPLVRRIRQASSSLRRALIIFVVPARRQTARIFIRVPSVPPNIRYGCRIDVTVRRGIAPVPPRGGRTAISGHFKG